VLKRTMKNDFLAAIDNETACLEQAKAVVAAPDAVVAKRKPADGRRQYPL